MLILWNVSTGEEIWTIRDNTDVSTVVFSQTDPILAYGAHSGRVAIVKLVDGSQSIELDVGDVKKVTSVAFSPDGKILATGLYTSDLSVIFWDVTTGNKLGYLYGACANLNSLAFSPNGEYLAYGGDGHVNCNQSEGIEIYSSK